MDTDQFVARFEAERQALALMDHPSIARVFDAGTTDTGLPFFVMELVHGVPITDYCDRGRLSTEQRLALFMPVCQAIQHAHQKGIIHRDIKPSNVMVTQVDGKPLPKVIDFGVAKAINQRLTEKTMFTQFGSVVGTLEYMSPEQADVSGLDVDTRFVRKHRAALLTAGTFVAMLVAMSVLSTWQAIRATTAERQANAAALRAISAERETGSERDRARRAEAEARKEAESARRSAAESEAVRKFLEDDLLAAARPGGQGGGLGKDATIRQAVDRVRPKITAVFKNQPTIEAAVRNTLGTTEPMTSPSPTRSPVGRPTHSH